MNKIALFLGTILLLLASSCDTSSTTQKEALAAQEAELIEKEKVLLEKEKSLKLREQELLQREDAVSKIEAAAEATDFDDVGLPPPVEKEEEHLIRLGKHNITLQWIGWDNPGAVDILYEKQGLYRIKGEQRSKKDSNYLLIDGTLKPINAKQLLFEGKIEYLVHFNNGGKPCIKTGPLMFRATGTRKYWRLKEKTNCEGGNLVDYVDIYF